MGGLDEIITLSTNSWSFSSEFWLNLAIYIVAIAVPWPINKFIFEHIEAQILVINKFWILKKVSPAPILLNFGLGSQTTVLNFWLSSRPALFFFGLGSLTTVLNFGFGSRTTALNFWLGNRTTLGLGLVVRLQYSTLGWVVGLQNSSSGWVVRLKY